jgi:hypothetical protein
MLEKMRDPRTRTWSIVLLVLLVVTGVVGYLVEGKREIPLPPVLRITVDPDAKTEHLEVPLVRYSKAQSYGELTTVDFVGAVHLGERSYYEDLNNRFKDYDVVLYELVSDGENLPEQNGEPSDSILGTVQRAMCNLIGLTFQLDVINYRAKNFVHADLSPEELHDAMQARGESLPQLLMRLIKLSTDPELQKTLEAKGYNEALLKGINPLLILLRGPTPQERLIMRRFMAQGLIGSDTVLKALEGEKGFSLITDRNAEVMAVLNNETAAGHRTLAIFYGVGHLPDLHERLVKQGYRITQVEWMRAWNM